MHHSIAGAAALLLTCLSVSGQQSDAPYGVDRHGKALRFPPGVEPGMHHEGFNAALPTLWTIGDSTVKNGRENGREGGRWGWGDELVKYFDGSRINIENQALGGTSSRSFARDWWPDVVEMIQPGDFVLMQFGHNDGGVNSKNDHLRLRGTLPGNGDDTLEMEVKDGAKETVHTYGWYLRKMIAEIRAKGATPIVCSLIPRNAWTEPHTMLRGQDDTYTKWAAEAAAQEHVSFINLNHIIAGRLDPLGKDFSDGTLYRLDDPTHTTLLGAQFNAHCVIAGLKALGDDLPLNQFLSPTAEPVKPAPSDNVSAAAAP